MRLSRRLNLLALAGLAVTLPVIAHDHSSQNYEIDPDSFSDTLSDLETTVDSFHVHVPADATVPQADVYFLADTTGSMGSVISSVRSGASTIVSDLYADLAADGVDVQIGAGNYKDFPYDAYAFDHQVDLVGSTSEASVLAAVNAWSASGGYDGSEGQFFALNRIAADVDPDGGSSIGWREDAKKIVVWFGDAPGHDSVCSAISGLAEDITESSVTTDLVDADITVIAIGTTTGFSNALDDNPSLSAYNYSSFCTVGGSSGQASRIAAATGGSYTSGINSSTIVSTIVDAVENEVSEIDNLSVEVNGDIADFVTDVSPSAGYDSIDVSAASDHDFDVTFEGVCQDSETTFTGTIDAVADGAVVVSQTVTLTMESCNEPPVAVCEDIELVADEDCLACDTVDGGSYDPDGDDIIIDEDPGCDYELGDTDVTLTVEDEYGESDSCTATVTVVDETGPEIDCNAPETITPPDAPISFTATVTDNCGDGDASVHVTAYDCWTENGAGKVIDKTNSCVVSYADDTVTIDDSGGVGDIIEWTVEATDGSGNTTEVTCSVEVVNPSGNGNGNGKGK